MQWIKRKSGEFYTHTHPFDFCLTGSNGLFLEDGVTLSTFATRNMNQEELNCLGHKFVAMVKISKLLLTCTALAEDNSNLHKQIQENMPKKQWQYNHTSTGPYRKRKFVTS